MTKQYLVVLAADRTLDNPKYNLVIAFANGPMRNNDGSIKDVMMQSGSYSSICGNLNYRYSHQFWNQANNKYAGLFSKENAKRIVNYYNNYDFNSHARMYTIHQFKVHFKWAKETITLPRTPTLNLVNAKGQLHANVLRNQEVIKAKIKRLTNYKQPLNDRYVVISAVDSEHRNFVCAVSPYDYGDDTTDACCRNNDGSYNDVSLDDNHSYREIIHNHDYWFSYQDALKLQKRWSKPYDNHIQIYSYSKFIKHFAYMKYSVNSSQWNNILGSTNNINSNYMSTKTATPIRELQYLDKNFDNLSLHKIHSDLSQITHELLKQK